MFGCWDPQIGRDVAVKRLKDRSLEASALQELRAPAIIDHPNIVQIYDVLPDDAAFVMQMVDGTSLGDRLAVDADGIRAAFEDVALQLLDALAAAHRNRVVHRDIKPENVLVTADLHVRIADFGLARMLSDSGAAHTPVGTPNYAAPEVITGEPYDESVDIYSLGTMFYEIWTGTLPFEGSSIQALFLQKLTGGHSPARELNPKTPAWISDLLEGMLSSSPPRPSAELLRGEFEAHRQPAIPARSASIDDYHKALTSIYGFQNARRGPLVITARFLANLEGVVGGVKDAEHDYGRSRADAYFPKAFAWLSALLTTLNFRFSQLIDFKFPSHCPYCGNSPCTCATSAYQDRASQNQQLLQRIKQQHSHIPEGSGRPFAEYQRMFDDIYGERNRTAGIDSVGLNALASVAQFTDALLRLRSLKELEVIDILPLELADQIAWFFALLNIYARETQFDFGAAFAATYPDRCHQCGMQNCRCGEIEHEIRLANWRDFQ